MTQLLLPIIYLAFISLGLPDSLLGSAWPTMYPQLGIPFSYAGILSMIISLGTIVSSLNSDRLTRALGTGKVTALSVGMTAAALFGFSVSGQFWMLCLWAVPYGLGAGSVDAALNNYVALHYESRHMSWLHCMWGVGTIISPVLMSLALTGGQGWNGGYRIVALIQVGITAVLVLSLPLWKGRPAAETADGTPARPLTLPQILAIPGAREVMLCFFCYCGLETTAGLWASSYLTLSKGVPADTAAAFAGLFYLGITVGRGFCGFVTLRSGRGRGLPASAGAAGALAGRPRPRGAGLCAHLPQHHPLHAGPLRRGPVAGCDRHPDGKRLCRQSGHAAAVRPAGKQRCPCPLPRVSAGAADPDDRHARAAHPEDGMQINNFLTGGIFMLRIEYFDKDRFMRQVSASRGSVLLHLDNGKTCDLKEDATASSILRMMNAPKKGFDITVTDPAAVTGFLRYMLEAGRMDRVAG